MGETMPGEGERWTLWRFAGECAENYGGEWHLALNENQKRPHRPEIDHGSETEVVEVVPASRLEAAESENLALRTSVGHLDSRIGELESALRELVEAVEQTDAGVVSEAAAKARSILPLEGESK